MEHNTQLFLEIVTPQKILFRSEIELVHIPGAGGSFSILRGHAPIIAGIKPGVIRVIGLHGGENLFQCDEGVVECNQNQITILIERGSELK